MEQITSGSADNLTQSAPEVVDPTPIIDSADANKIQVLKKDLSKDEEEMKQLELKKKQDDEHVQKLTQDLKQQGEEVKKLE